MLANFLIKQIQGQIIQHGNAEETLPRKQRKGRLRCLSISQEYTTQYDPQLYEYSFSYCSSTCGLTAKTRKKDVTNTTSRHTLCIYSEELE